MVQSDEQQQQEDDKGGRTKQQQQTTTKLTVKVKGQQVDDLKEFLARKKQERTAWGNSVVKLAETNTQPGVLDLWRAQREKLGGISDLVNTSEVTGGAAKGKL